MNCYSDVSMTVKGDFARTYLLRHAGGGGGLLHTDLVAGLYTRFKLCKMELEICATIRNFKYSLDPCERPCAAPQQRTEACRGSSFH